MPAAPETTIYATGTTSASKIAAPGAGLRIEVTKIEASCASNSAVLSFLDGDGGTTMAACIPGHNVGVLEGKGNGLFTLTANTALFVGASTGAWHAMITYRVI